MRALAAILGLAAAMPVAAQERPPIVPSRDVAVTYQIKAAPQPMEERWRFHAADQLARLDVGNQTYMLSDMRGHTATMVSDRDRKAVQMPMPGPDLAGMSGQSFRRLGTLTIAGVPCTEWQTTDIRGRDVIACLTVDGVLLRARHGEQVAVEASSVSYDRQDPALFAVPAGYQRVTPPARQ